MEKRDTPLPRRTSGPTPATGLSVPSLLAELALTLGLLTVTGASLLAALVLGSAAAVALVARQPPRRTIFHLAALSLAGAAGVLVFRQLVAIGLPTWAAALPATSTYALAGAAFTSLWAGLIEARTSLGQHVRDALLAILTAAGTAALTIVGYRLTRADDSVALLLILPAALWIAAVRGYTRTRSRQEHLEFLYDSMRQVQGAEDFRGAAEQLLRQLAYMLRADFAELLFNGRAESGQVQVFTLRRGKLTAEVRAIRAEERLLLIHAVLSQRSLLLSAGHRPHPVDRYLAARGLEDTVIAPLRGEERELGAIVVGNPAGRMATFSSDDCRLFETFTAHAAVLLENDQLERSLARLTKLEGKLRHQAYHDALTGLANRQAFIEATSDALARAPTPPVVLFIDLDDFKLTNDSLGHAAGDELLRVAAQRVAGCLRAGDLAARFGGDEFAVLLAGGELEQAEEVATRIADRLAEPVELHGHECSLRASIGIAQGAEGGTAETLLRDADLAMYAAKEHDAGSYILFRPELRRQVRARHNLATALSHSLERDEIAVAYQPVVSLETGVVTGFEALVRWRRGDEEVLLPPQFFELAERTGMMAPIGRFVLAEACRRAAEWNALGWDVNMSVNLSASELRDPSLSHELATLFGATGLEPSRLALEIPEATAMAEPEETIELLARLRALGVRIALDDFGAGYSSLSHLEAMPVDVLKVPKQLVDGLRGENPRTVVLGAVQEVASSLGLAVVAEGVEEPEQLERLRELGYREAQGFLLAPPLPADEAARILQRRELLGVSADAAA